MENNNVSEEVNNEEQHQNGSVTVSLTKAEGADEVAITLEGRGGDLIMAVSMLVEQISNTIGEPTAEVITWISQEILELKEARGSEEVGGQQ